MKNKRELNCIHNTALYPDYGVICDKREPNSLCKNCKSYESKYKSYESKSKSKIELIIDKLKNKIL